MRIDLRVLLSKERKNKKTNLEFEETSLSSCNGTKQEQNGPFRLILYLENEKKKRFWEEPAQWPIYRKTNTESAENNEQ